MALTENGFCQYLRAPVIAGMLLLSGCGSFSSDDNAVDALEPESVRLKQCHDELEALNAVVPEEYQKFKKEFDRLMLGAAQYSGLRSMVGSGTQTTVDALYQYRVHLLCAGIGQAMLSGLAEKGERS
ncbi:hypothetical protein ABGT23_01815 [Enterobacter cloacae]|uniref:hypothetical protein n=1 Tax=Enterobacter cloacae TaxID=550 RepID=UPI00345CD69D